MPSLYVQDTWTVGNRLTLNLGVRTEQRDDSVVPHRHQGERVRVRLRQEDRAAPRRDLRRARRRPAEGVRQLGPLLRLGQVRAGARLVRRRHLARQLPLARHARRQQPEPVEHARAATSGAASRDRRVPNFDTIDPDLKPMFQDATNLGLEYQLNADDGARRQLRAQQPDPRDRGRRLARRDRQRGLLRRQPRRRRGDDDVRDRPDRAVRHAEAAAAVRRARLDDQPPLLEQLVRQREPARSAGCMATTPGWRTRTRSPRRRPARRRPPRSSRPAASRVPAPPPAARGTSTSSCGTRTATSTCAAAWPPIVRSSRSSTAPTGCRSARRSAAFVYAGSGTPMSTVVNTTNTIPVLVNGRGDMGRTPS